jgi:hypothetical protein
MEFLALDDPRWKDLDHRNWRHGKRSDWAPDAPFVPDELAKLQANPGDRERFVHLWPWLCSEGTSYSAAYAAVPYFVTFAEQLPPEQRADYLSIVGLIETHSRPQDGCSFEIKDYLKPSYYQALAVALPLVAEALLLSRDRTETRYLLAAAAALKGHQKLAEVLQDMDCVCGKCPKCGEPVYPPELQEAIR